MLDRIDFESLQQQIRLYCKGKDHGEYILQSIDEGPFKMGRCRDEIASGTEGPYLGPEQDKVVADLSQAEKDRRRADIQATNILFQALPRDIYKLINHNTNAKDIWDNVKMLLEGSKLTKDDHESQLYDEFEHFGQHKGESIHDYYVRGDRTGLRETMLGELLLLEMRELRTELNSDYFKEKMLLMQAQENRVDLDEEQPLFLASGQTNTFDDDVDEGPVQDMAQNEDNIFQADQCDAFDYDVDEAPTAQIMFMANLSSAEPVYDEAGPSYDSDTLFEVAIGYKNPFYLSKAKQVQLALCNGHEIVKTNHDCALVHYSEDTLEIAETIRKQIIKKNKRPNVCEKEEHFEGIQKALINEIKEMKEVFDQIEAKVDQNVVNKKCDGIERKNLLIENENLIAKCLSKDVFYTATDSVLTVSIFFDMHDAYTVVQKLTSSDAPVFESVFVIENLKEQLQGRGNIIRELKEKISRLQKKHSKADPILDFKALDSQNKDLNAKVNALQDLNERFRAENKKVKQHYKELDVNGVDLIKGNHGTNLYTISVEDMMKSSPICLLSKASKNKSWLWHRQLNHLNFGTINDLTRKDLVRGLSRLRFKKDHLCSAFQLGKSKKSMRVPSINGKKYVLVTVDYNSRFTRVKYLRSKVETSYFVIKFLKQIQVGLNKTVRYIRTDNGTEFVNQVLPDFYESVGIFHQKSVPRTPQQTMLSKDRIVLLWKLLTMFSLK
nr:retrovirus-related Pol polyprotein from transposon TNT 1-94 [Tanacetum cinerariifolium]